jgi:hypothetical protein
MYFFIFPFNQMQGIPNMIHEPFPHQCSACISCISLGDLRSDSVFPDLPLLGEYCKSRSPGSCINQPLLLISSIVAANISPLRFKMLWICALQSRRQACCIPDTKQQKQFLFTHVQLMAGSCECDNEPSGSIKCVEFLDWLRPC